MGYNNNYNNSGYNGNRNNGYDNRPRKKRSGAKSGVGKNGKIYVSAWNASKEKGLIVVSAFENSKSTKSISKTGNRFITMMFEIIYRKTGAKILEVANYNTTTGKVYLERIGMVISTKAPNGGYMGQIKSR